MIPGNELRLGNYILATSQLRKVNQIGDLYVEVFDEISDGPSRMRHSLSDIFPVPLSEDVLLHCGFVYRDHFKFWQLISGEKETRSEMDIDNDFNVIDFMRRPVVKTLTSLHQLQNIFFSLKGRELIYSN